MFKARDSTVCPFYYTYLCTSHFVYLRGHARADLRRICGLKVKVRGFINTQQPKLATTKEECVSERGGMAEHNKNLLPLLFASLGLKTVLLLFASIPFLEPDLTLTMEVNGVSRGTCMEGVWVVTYNLMYSLLIRRRHSR